jgi:hypothetical protein
MELNPAGTVYVIANVCIQTDVCPTAGCNVEDDFATLPEELRRAIRSENSAAIAELLERAGTVLRLNASRNALQLLSCDRSSVVAHFQLPDHGNVTASALAAAIPAHHLRSQLADRLSGARDSVGLHVGRYRFPHTLDGELL